MITLYKRSQVWQARQLGRAPVIGRFYRKMANNMEADFWRVWRRWMVISVVVNGGLWLYNRKFTNDLNAELDNIRFERLI